MLLASIRDPDPLRDGEFTVPTIFSFMPANSAGPLSRAQCAALYELLQDRGETRRPDGRRCRVGQPVAFGADAAVLRMSSSARLVTRAWSGNPATAIARLQAEITQAEGVVERLAHLARDFPSSPS